MSDLDLSDLEGFVKDSNEEPSGSSAYFEKSLEIIRESMGRVKQEILLTLPDGTPHMVYVTDIKISPKGEVQAEFATPSEDRKNELAEHVVKCVTMQIQQAFDELKSKDRWWKW